MNRTYLKDQRGVAMVVELLLVAVVLTVVGMAMYQTAKHDASKTADNTPAAIAASAAAIVESEQKAEASIGAEASASSDQIMDSDIDVTNLGGSTGGESF